PVENEAGDQRGREAGQGASKGRSGREWSVAWTRREGISGGGGARGPALRRSREQAPGGKGDTAGGGAGAPPSGGAGCRDPAGREEWTASTWWWWAGGRRAPGRPRGGRKRAVPSASGRRSGSP